MAGSDLGEPAELIGLEGDTTSGLGGPTTAVKIDQRVVAAEDRMPKGIKVEKLRLVIEIRHNQDLFRGAQVIETDEGKQKLIIEMQDLAVIEISKG